MVKQALSSVRRLLLSDMPNSPSADDPTHIFTVFLIFQLSEINHYKSIPPAAGSKIQHLVRQAPKEDPQWVRMTSWEGNGKMSNSWMHRMVFARGWREGEKRGDGQ